MKIAAKHLPKIQKTVASVRYDGQLAGQKVFVSGSFPGYGMAGAKFCLALGGADITPYQYSGALCVRREETGNGWVSLEDALWVASCPVAAGGARPQLDDLIAAARSRR